MYAHTYCDIHIHTHIYRPVARIEKMGGGAGKQNGRGAPGEPPKAARIEAYYAR